MPCLFAVALPAVGVELYEDFHNAPSLSEGWTYGVTNNVTLGSWSGTSTTLDAKTAAPEERTALKVERTRTDSQVFLEILSPWTDDCICECSFFCKVSSSGDCSVRVSVRGRVSEESEWKDLGNPIPVTSKGQWPTNGVAQSLNIHQVKFILESDVENFKNVGLDSLRIKAGEDLPSGDDPTGPTKPTNVKLEATASDRIQVTWEGVPGERGYRVELFQVEDRRDVDTPDFSGLGSAVWPEGWTHSDDLGFDWYSSDKLIKVLFNTCWFASPFYTKPITRFEYKFKSNKTSSEVENTKLVVKVSKTESGDDWVEFSRHQVSGSMSNVVSNIDAGEGVRRLRFSVDYQGSDTAYAREMLLGINIISVVCGESSAELVAEAEPTEPTAVISNLNATASYFATVAPNPAEDPGLAATSGIIDLSKEHFRRTGALPVTAMLHGYEERFDSLSNFVSKTKTAKMDLDYWQFVLNGADMDALGVSQTNSASNVAGCYVCRDKERISFLDSSMIGTLASGDKSCAVGLAITNDSGTALKNLKVTFDSVQRSSNTNSATYVFEWRISVGETSIAAGSDWKQVSIPQTAPITSAVRSVMPEHRQRDIVAAIPAKLPAGSNLLVRWHHPPTTSGPMMAIDNVRIAFDKSRRFCLFIK